MVAKSLYRSVDLINSVNKTIVTNQLMKAADRILLSTSGGQDSICLLILFNQLYYQMELDLSLLWCHHLWQFDSFSLMRQITKLSFIFQFNSCFVITSKFVPSELLARNWRQNSSNRLCLFYNYYKIILAHSANDKVETILLNLLRGTGTTGLSPLGRIKLIDDISPKGVEKSSQKGEHTSQIVTSAHSMQPVSFFYWLPFDLLTFAKQRKNTKKESIKKLLPAVICPPFEYRNICSGLFFECFEITCGSFASPLLRIGDKQVYLQEHSKRVQQVKNLGPGIIKSKGQVRAKQKRCKKFTSLRGTAGDRDAESLLYFPRQANLIKDLFCPPSKNREAGQFYLVNRFFCIACIAHKAKDKCVLITEITEGDSKKDTKFITLESSVAASQALCFALVISTDFASSMHLSKVLRAVQIRGTEIHLSKKSFFLLANVKGVFFFFCCQNR